MPSSWVRAPTRRHHTLTIYNHIVDNHSMGDVLQVQQGSLYPALHRLEEQGWIRAKWSESETGREAKFYSLTTAGRAHLEKEKENWKRLSSAIDLVVESA